MPDRPGSSDRQDRRGRAQDCWPIWASRAGRSACIGDRTARAVHSAASTDCSPQAKFVADNAIIDRMQRIRSPREIATVSGGRAADLDRHRRRPITSTRPGVTDAEIYAAFTYAQMARGGETGDGYQIGINRYGTHCGKPYGHVVRRGDLINLYISNVTYRGYTAQTARMIAVGDDHRAPGDGAGRVHGGRESAPKS